MACEERDTHANCGNFGKVLPGSKRPKLCSNSDSPYPLGELHSTAWPSADSWVGETALIQLLQSNALHLRVKYSQDHLRGLRERMLVLIYGPGSAVFYNSCKAIEDALQPRNERTSSEATQLFSVKSFKRTHLSILITREETILQLLIDRIKASLQRYVDREELQLLVYLTYSSFRLHKAQRELEGLMSNTNQSDEILRQKINRYATVAFAKWSLWVKHSTRCDHTSEQKGRLLNLLMHRSKRDPKSENTFLSNLGCTDSDVFKDFRDLLYMEYSESKESCSHGTTTQEQFLEYADMLFYKSVYHSGFPHNQPKFDTEGDKNREVSKHFRFNYDMIKSSFVELVYKSTEIKLFGSNHTLMKTIVECLYYGQVASEKWLWMHYTGHHRIDGIPGVPIAVKGAFNLVRDLFTNIVISLDCCNPDIETRASEKHITSILACASNETTDFSEAKTLTNFTQQLVCVLKGCDPLNCPFRPYFRSCELCQRLRRKILEQGFVSDNDVKLYLKVHLSKGYTRNASDNQPLVYVT